MHTPMHIHIQIKMHVHVLILITTHLISSCRDNSFIPSLYFPSLLLIPFISLFYSLSLLSIPSSHSLYITLLFPLFTFHPFFSFPSYHSFIPSPYFPSLLLIPFISPCKLLFLALSNLEEITVNYFLHLSLPSSTRLPSTLNCSSPVCCVCLFVSFKLSPWSLLDHFTE